LGERDPYEVLGVDRTASLDEVWAAWRRLCEIYDSERYVNSDPSVRAEAKRRMAEGSAAYISIARAPAPDRIANSSGRATDALGPGETRLSRPPWEGPPRSEGAASAAQSSRSMDLRLTLAVRTGSVLGALLGALGVLLLPWVEARESSGGRATFSMFRVREVLLEDTERIEGLSRTIVNLGPFVLLAGAVGAVLFAVMDLRGDNAVVALTAIGAAGAWCGYLTYLANQQLEEGSLVLSRFGVSFHIGPGAWLSIAGAAIAFACVGTAALVEHGPIRFNAEPTP
jgi:hypothetical protein